MNPDSDRNQEDRPSYSDLIKPPPYPLDEALEQAYAPEPPPLPPHTPDNWEQAQGHGQPQPPSTAQEHATGQQGTSAVTVTGTSAAAGRAGAAVQLLATGQTPDQRGSRAMEVPESVTDSLQGLPRWQVYFVLALMRLGGIMSMASAECSVSVKSVEKAIAASPRFAEACHYATMHATDVAEAAIYRAATIGNLAPVWHQGILVGYKRVQSMKAAELLMQMRGRLAQSGRATELVYGANGKMNVYPAAEVGSLVGSILSALCSGHRGRPQIMDAEEVE